MSTFITAFFHVLPDAKRNPPLDDNRTFASIGKKPAMLVNKSLTLTVFCFVFERARDCRIQFYRRFAYLSALV
jgi:hypothetical protein